MPPVFVTGVNASSKEILSLEIKNVMIIHSVTAGKRERERGDNGLFITLVPKVL